MVKKELHSGHRQRLRDIVKKFGFDNLNDYQKMEYILTMASPRKDVNDVAHRLIDEFGCVSKVLETDSELLSEVEGVGKATAEILSIIPQIANFYFKDRFANNQDTVTNYRTLHNYLKHIYYGSEHEKVVLILISKNNDIKTHLILNEGSFNQVEIDVPKLTKWLCAYKSTKCIICHNHPQGKVFPSEADIKTNTRIVPIFNSLNVEMVDNLIYTETALYSFKVNKLVKIV